MNSTISFETQLQAARDGSESALGDLLGRYRKLLKMLVRTQLHGPMQAKADASDVVQDTLMNAVKGFASFQGVTESSLIAWLRTILACQLANLYRHHYAGRRSIQLEQRLDAQLHQSSMALQGALQTDSSPSQQAANEEQLVALADAIESLPEHYRTVILLRYVRGQQFSDIAEHMGRSRDGVRKLWVRALAQLKKAMETK